MNERNTTRNKDRPDFNGWLSSARITRIPMCGRRGRRRRDMLDAIGWAIVFIWSSFLLMAHLTGFDESYGWWDGWGLFFIGIAAIVLIGTIIRWLVPKYRRRGLALGLVFGLILLSIGLGEIALWIWPLLLGAIGISILLRVFITRH